MVSFTCNVCGSYNELETFATEPASCACGSNVRVRALIHLLSLELFGRSIPLTEFPDQPYLRGLGMTDKEGYAGRLAHKFDYTNTFYDRQPRFDFTEPHPDIAGSFDFILSADVLEHIAPPVDRALAEVARLLKPDGFLVATVYCNPEDRMREHFPDLNEFRIVMLGDSPVLVNRASDGALSVCDRLIFHGGSGATLEMREFGMTELRKKLLGAGFREVYFFNEDVPELGILFDADVSQPLVARKEAAADPAYSRRQLFGRLRAAEAEAARERERAEGLERRLREAGQSKWVRLGRKLGFGPELSD